MKELITTCDRCSARASTEDSFWELAFTRETLVDDMTEFISESWDLCESCYAAVSPSVVLVVSPQEED